MTHVEASKTLAPERYLLGEMSEIERHAFEDHFFSCTECAEDVRAGSRMQAGVKAGLLPAGRARARVTWQVPSFAPWAMAAALAGVAAYQSIWLVPDLRRQAGPQVLEPVILRPATRGADPTLVVRAGHPVALAIDVNGADGTRELSYAVQDAQGATVSVGRAPSPPAGTPLLLLLPGTTFATPGRYIIRLGDQAGGGSVGEYRFVVEIP